MSLVEELSWRGLIHDITPGTEAQLAKESTSGYVGFDPTADSLHIGNLVPIMLLVHLQRAGHKPFALIGGATGRVGDPSGKTQERQLLDTADIEHNLACQKKQLEQFLTFGNGPTDAEIVNNFDWFKDYNFLDFIRDVGKHLTVNYMLAKDSVKNRLEQGMSFTEFSYQLIQGYDFYHLLTKRNVRLQMGGSDQWGNITTGIELCRRLNGGECHAITAPLVKKADGTKFGKSEGGNVWLDAEKTSPYAFYQFWLNVSDEDVRHFTKIFSLKSRQEIEALIADHAGQAHLRLAQKALAEELTARIHGAEALEIALQASNILFGNATSEALRQLSPADFLEVFDGVEMRELEQTVFAAPVDLIELLSDLTGFCASRGDARRALKENSISVNKEKVVEGATVSGDQLINGQYLVLQRGKKNYFLVKAV